MNYEQLASFEPALAEFLGKVRHGFKRDKTFMYLQKYLLGLMADLKRKSIEPIALACGVAVRTVQEFLSYFKWDHHLVSNILIRELLDGWQRSAKQPDGGLSDWLDVRHRFTS